MSLLPLTVFDCLRRAYRVALVDSFVPEDSALQLANRLVESASLVDVIKWRGVSQAFRSAANRRIASYSRLHIRVYEGLAELRAKSATEAVQWPSSGNVIVCEIAPGTVGICVDSRLTWKDAKAMIGLLAIFRRTAEFVFMDSPIVDLLLKDMNSSRVRALVSLLSQQRRSSFTSSTSFTDSHFDDCDSSIVLPEKSSSQPTGPFFSSLKQFTITCNKSQLIHLSRVISYCVAVESVFEKEGIDLVCLQVILGDSWCRSKQRLFRHVSSFKQWLDASSLGVKYIQQFQEEQKRKRIPR